MILDSGYQSAIISHFGNPSPIDLMRQILAADINDSSGIRLVAVSDRLGEIEELRRQNLPDSMAVKVGKLQLDYWQHYKLLWIEAYNLVEEMAGLLGIAGSPPSIYYDNKYALLAYPDRCVVSLMIS